jgi:hypothetical protein
MKRRAEISFYRAPFPLMKIGVHTEPRRFIRPPIPAV